MTEIALIASVIFFLVAGALSERRFNRRCDGILCEIQAAKPREKNLVFLSEPKQEKGNVLVSTQPHA